MAWTPLGLVDYDPADAVSSVNVEAWLKYAYDSAIADAVAGGGSSLGFDVQDYGAIGDGVADDTAEIQAAVAAAEAVDGVVIFSPCTGGYGVSLTSGAISIPLPPRVSILGSGYAGRIKRIGTYPLGITDPRTQLIGSSNATLGALDTFIRNLYIDGVNHVGQATANATASSNQLTNLSNTEGFVVGQTIWVGGADTTATGIAAGSSASKSIHETTIAGISGTTITMATVAKTTSTGASVTINVGDPAATTPSSGGLNAKAIQLFASTSTTFSRTHVEGNTIVNWPGAAIQLFAGNFYSVRGNIIKSPQRGGIVVYRASAAGVISGNMVDNSGDDSIALVSTVDGEPSDTAITGNRCSVRPMDAPNGIAAGAAIVCYGGNDIAISGNQCRGGSLASISVTDFDSGGIQSPIGLTITGNQIVNQQGAGISIQTVSSSTGGPTDLTVTGNQVRVAGTQGIRIWLNSGTDMNRLTIQANHLQSAGSTFTGANNVLYGNSTVAGIEVGGNTGGTIIQLVIRNNHIGTPAAEGIRIAGATVSWLVCSQNRIQNPNNASNPTTDAIYIDKAQFAQIHDNQVGAGNCRHAVYTPTGSVIHFSRLFARASHFSGAVINAGGATNVQGETLPGDHFTA